MLLMALMVVVPGFAIVVVLSAIVLRVSCWAFNQVARSVGPVGDAGGQGVAVAEALKESTPEVLEVESNPFAAPRVSVNPATRNANAGVGSVPTPSFMLACGIGALLSVLRLVLQILLIVVMGQFAGTTTSTSSGSASSLLLIGAAMGALVVHFFATSGMLQLWLPTSFSKSLAVSGVSHMVAIVAGGAIAMLFSLML
jgi:hypothetical protein